MTCQIQLLLRIGEPDQFNPTKIQFEMPVRSRVTIKIYNVLGQEIKTLVDSVEAEGYKSVTWDGTSNWGTQVASGVFFYQLQARAFSGTKELLLLKWTDKCD